MSSVLGKPSWYLPGGPGPRRLASKWLRVLRGKGSVSLTPAYANLSHTRSGALYGQSPSISAPTSSMPRRYKRSTRFGARRRLRRRVGRRVRRTKLGRRSRRVLRRRLRRGVRRSRGGGGFSWSFKTNVRSAYPSQGVNSGIVNLSYFGSLNSNPANAGALVPQCLNVDSNGVYPTTPAPSVYAEDGLLGIEQHPWFLYNFAVRLGDFPAVPLANLFQRYRQWTISRIVVQYTGRAAANVFSGEAAQGTPTEIIANPGVGRGGDIAFVNTARSGPLTIPIGYGTLGLPNRFTNQQAFEDLPNHPYYKVQNMPLSRRRKYVQIRRDVAFGMKPVVMKIVPRRNGVRWERSYTASTNVSSPSAIDAAFPISNTVRAQEIELSRRSKYRWNDTFNWVQNNPVDPDAENTRAVYEPHYGWAMVTRPGSWTKMLFPFLNMKVWVRVRFRGLTVTDPSPDTTNLYMYTQMNFAGPMLMA